MVLTTCITIAPRNPYWNQGFIQSSL